ncbi:MAG TPA: hypothetical protein VGH54_09425 [Mycobacterium sp.]|jgi:hypothetical protein|uniref:hypothetical protein n=1 Tax=Mycobacterium sp. TaxID=1785 RepID=UPI002F41432C
MLKRVILFGGALVVAVAAGWASFATLAALAKATQWPGGYFLLPTSIDVLGALACYVWLTKSFPQDARRFARWTTLFVIAASVVGNGIGHLVSFGKLTPSVLLIVLVGAVPPSSLAALIHLIVLATSTPVPAKQVRKTEPARPQAKTEPPAVPAKPSSPPKKTAVPKPSPVKSGPESGPVVDDVLMQRARHADRTYQEKNNGSPITRDALKAELKIGTGKATDLLDALKKEREVA